MKHDAMLRYYLMKTKYNEPNWHDMSEDYKIMIKSTAEYQFFVLNTDFKRFIRAMLNTTRSMKSFYKRIKCLGEK